MTSFDIDGWTTFHDLYDHVVSTYVVSAVPRSRPLVFVEVGCWMGRSVIYLAEKIRDAGLDAKVYAVDNWTGSACDGLDEAAARYEREGKSLYDRFRENVIACGVSRYVVSVRTDSAEGAKFFKDGECDFVFLDADHRFDAVVADIRAWRPKVRPGGLLAGHDLNRQSVEDAVRAVLGTSYQVWGGGPARPENGNLTCWTHEVPT